MNSITSSVPHCPEAKDVTDLRYSWLKDAIFNVKVFLKLSNVLLLEDYLGYLINISLACIKKDLPLETSYSIIYTKGR
jgi:hypothetical protein